MLRQHCAIGKQAEQYLLILRKRCDNVSKKFFFLCDGLRRFVSEL